LGLDGRVDLVSAEAGQPVERVELIVATELGVRVVNPGSSVVSGR